MKSADGVKEKGVPVKSVVEKVGDKSAEEVKK